MSRIYKMKSVLWEPEIGKCSECGCDNLVRKYSFEGKLRTFCFPCWDLAQEPRVMSSLDWNDDDQVVFTFPAEEAPSRAA